MKRSTQRPCRGELRRCSGSRGGQSDRRILETAGSAANSGQAIQSQRLTAHRPSLGPEKADLGRLAPGSATSPPCDPVWARVGRTGMVAS